MNVRWGCPCSERDALVLLQDQTALALSGTPEDAALLPAYVEHYLFVLARKASNERSRN